MSDARPYIAHRLVAAGHALFVRGDLNLNLIGVRSPNRQAGFFDDRIYAVWREGGHWLERSWAATVDPGRYYSINPLNPKGAARLVPGQYRGAWEIGRHKGRYPALVQRKPVSVWRDGNRDGTLDPGHIDTGLFGINIHAADSDPFDTTDRIPHDVGRWSAGCQVFERSADYREFWGLVLRAASVWGPVFTYTLIED